MERINFEDGEIIKKGYVTIDGVQHEITETQYSGTTPLSAYILNKLQDNIETETNKIVDTVANTTKNGLMSSTDKAKLNGIASNANNYSLPIASETTLGGVKVGNNLSILNGVLNATNTTYSNATTSSNGLMSSVDKTKLDGINNEEIRMTMANGANLDTYFTRMNRMSIIFGNNMQNAPNANWWTIISLNPNPGASGYGIQIAYGINDKISKTRYCTNGTWSAWT